MRSRALYCFVVVAVFCGAFFASNNSGDKVQAAENSFTKTTVADNLEVPIGMQFSSDGDIYIAEKYGTIKVLQKNGQISTFGSVAVNGDFEQGLLGIVLDPAFAQNGYIYLAYTRPDGDNNRVSRVTASKTNHHLMEPGSEKVLLDNIPSSSGIHQMGEMQIGKDGKLYIASGDGSIDAQTSGLLDTLSGKMLRLNLDGTIPDDNPFVGQPGKRAEIWAYGLRNPYSSGMQASTGRIFVNDVGNDTWEEINELQKGANYGWTQCEGACNRPGFTDPFYQYVHSDGPVVSRSITGGAWYENSVYPADFNGDYLFADYVGGWVKRIDTATKEVKDVADGLQGVVNIKVGPDGLLYIVQLDVNTGSGSIKRLDYGQPAPQTGKQLKVYAAGQPAAGQYPTLEILVNDKVVATQPNVQGNYYNRQFIEYTYNYEGTLTPDQIKINYPNDYLANGEDRNLYVDRIELDGTVIQTEDPSILSTGTWTPETNCNPGNKRSEELACGGYFQYGLPAQANQKPTAVIKTPLAETHYNAGNTISFEGSGNDAEDGALAPAKLSWNIVYNHADHSHPYLTFDGVSNGSFTIADAGETAANTYYRIILTATDSNGQTTTSTRDIYPNTVKLSFSTNVPGLKLELDGQPREVPATVDAVVGFKRSIGAPLTQQYDNKIYDFVGWSDNGAATHTITTPAINATYQATYKLRETNPTPATTIKIYAAGSPAAGQYPTMELQIDGQTVATYNDIRGNYNNRQFTEYTYVSDRAVNPGSVRLNFINDAMINGEDRNLYIDKISLNGTVYESEDQNTLSTGTWAPDSGCAPGNKRSETLSCGGYFQYGASAVTPQPEPQQGSTLSIYAAGQPAQAVYPTMQLVIGGKVVTAYTDIRGNYNNRQFIKYDYISPTKLSAGQIQVDFINDDFINGEDRNLYIDKIVLDGITHEAEAPNTLSLGSWNTATGCDGGYKSSEALSCNGYFRFQ